MDKKYRDLARKLDHAEAFPLIALQGIRDLRLHLDAVEAEAIRRARDLGASYADIADALQITRQGAAYKVRTAENKNHAGGLTEGPVLNLGEIENRDSAERS
jgi:hypothetical protein